MTKKITRGMAEAQINRGAKKVTEKDLEEVLKKREEIEKKFSGEGPLGKFLGDLKLLFGIIQDYIKGNYKAVPFWSLGAIATALIYVLTPVDLIPDFIPVIGYVDDAMVVATCLKMVKKDLLKYKEWKKEHI